MRDIRWPLDLMGHQYCYWRKVAFALKRGWKSRVTSHDTCWLETPVVELTIYHLMAEGIHDCCICVHPDNQGTIGAFKSPGPLIHGSIHPFAAYTLSYIGPTLTLNFLTLSLQRTLQIPPRAENWDCSVIVSVGTLSYHSNSYLWFMNREHWVHGSLLRARAQDYHAIPPSWIRSLRSRRILLKNLAEEDNTTVSPIPSSLNWFYCPTTTTDKNIRNVQRTEWTQSFSTCQED